MGASRENSKARNYPFLTCISGTFPASASLVTVIRSVRRLAYRAGKGIRAMP